jgi:hypothetical protein
MTCLQLARSLILVKMFGSGADTVVTCAERHFVVRVHACGQACPCIAGTVR